MSELEREMPSSELTEWFALFKIEHDDEVERRNEERVGAGIARERTKTLRPRRK